MKTIKLLLALIILLSINSCSDEEEVLTSIPCEEIGGEYATTLTLVDRSTDPSVADYCVTTNMQIVDGAGLIIEPGVVIEFAPNVHLQLGRYSGGVNAGYIQANGNAENPIVFKGTENIPGIWDGIMIGRSSIDVRNILNFCIVEYAGGRDYGVFVNSALGDGGGLLSLTNTTIRYTLGTAFLTDGDDNINQFSNNHFEGNEGPAIRINPQDFSHIDEATTFLDNLPNGVFGLSGAYADEISDGEVHIWNKLSDGASYYVNEKMELFNNTEIQINPGVDLVMNTNDAKLEVYYNSGSSIQALGTASDPINIRGPITDVVSWDGINLVDNTDNIFTYCNISEAGLSTMGHSGCNSYELTTINIGNCGRVNVQNSSISNSGGCAIFVQAANTSNLTQSENSFSNNSNGDICN